MPEDGQVVSHFDGEALQILSDRLDRYRQLVSAEGGVVSLAQQVRAARRTDWTWTSEISRKGTDDLLRPATHLPLETWAQRAGTRRPSAVGGCRKRPGPPRENRVARRAQGPRQEICQPPVEAGRIQ